MGWYSRLIDFFLRHLTPPAAAFRQPPDGMGCRGVNMQERPFTLSYVFFYLLFSADTWRIAAGFVCALLLGPLVTQGRDLSKGGEAMVWLMIMAIGWSVTAWPAKKITAALQRAVKRASK
jgi:hypothetical protein